MVASLQPTSPAGLDPGERAAAAAVEALRAALRAEDVAAVQAVRWLAPRPPGERDLLSDLAAAEGLEPAVHQLSRFWRRAEVRLERVRTIGPLEAEVYERLHLPGESLPIATLVRRTAVEAGWRVVCTNEAHDERFTLWLSCPAGRTIDDVSWSRAYEDRFGAGAELIMDGPGGVLGHPEHGWLAHVRGPSTPRAWPELLPGEGGRIVELTMALTPEARDRRKQLSWVLGAAVVFVDQLDGIAAFMPSHEKLVLPEAVRAAAATSTIRPDQALRFWARVETVDHHVVTTGLRQLGLPEVEAPEGLFGARTAQLVAWLGGKMIESELVPAFGTELVAGDETFLITAGRRGPRRGRSYGRWGAVRIAESDERSKRGSRSRMRVPSLA